MKIAIAIACASATTLASARARADDDQWVFPVGVNVGGALHDHALPAGVVLGAEASAARVAAAWRVPTFWRGAYVDGLYDFGARRGRVGVGPEIGVAFLGLDAGFVAQLGDGALRPGFAVRPMLTVGLVTLYARFVDVPGDSVVNRTWELGALFKWPIGIGPAQIGSVLH